MSMPTIKSVDPEQFWKESCLRSILTGVFCSLFLFLVLHIVGVAQNPFMECVVVEVVLPLKGFFQNSWRLFKRCHKPSRREFTKIAVATAVGFGIMGFLGYFVKLVHIPINNIIVS